VIFNTEKLAQSVLVWAQAQKALLTKELEDVEALLQADGYVAEDLAFPEE
jgi:hypothetical protein